MDKTDIVVGDDKELPNVIDLVIQAVEAGRARSDAQDGFADNQSLKPLLSDLLQRRLALHLMNS